jgi:hypothetical protein
MDTIQHAAHGWLIPKAIEATTGINLPPGVEVAGAIFGALPDIIGYIGRITTRGDWRAYRWAHGFDLEEAPGWVFWSVAIMRLALPMYALHCILDEHLHEVGERWWMFSERLHYESLGWIVTLLLISSIGVSL